MRAAAVFTMRREWVHADVPDGTGFGTVLRDTVARRLLLIALLNAAPVAVSATLFLFYVESALEAPGYEGPLLLAFFLSAAAAAPVWGILAERFGARDVLLSAMLLAIVAFGGTLFLGAGDHWLFAVICVGTGAAMGADLTLLPALFAARMAKISPSAAQGFGLWPFVSKFTLALAAVLLLPALEAAGFSSGAGRENPDAVIDLLRVMYAGIPCLLKLAAIYLLWRTPMTKDSP